MARSVILIAAAALFLPGSQVKAAELTPAGRRLHGHDIPGGRRGIREVDRP